MNRSGILNHDNFFHADLATGCPISYDNFKHSQVITNAYRFVTPVLTTYEQLTANQDTDISTTEYGGEGANSVSSLLYNVGIHSVKFMPYSASGAGNVICTLNNSAGDLLHTFWTYDMALLPTSNTNELIAGTMTPFTGTTAVGDSINVHTSDNNCKLSNNTSDPFDGTNSCRFYNFTTRTANDLGFEIIVSS